jgi:hypothetical protein
LFNVTVLLSKLNEVPPFNAGLTTALFDVPQPKNIMPKNTETKNCFLFIWILLVGMFFTFPVDLSTT